MYQKPYCLLLFSFWGLYLNAITASAQLNAKPITLEELISVAENNYPAIKAKKLQVKAAQKQIAINKNSIVPALDLAIQGNMATHNNIGGMVFPQYILPISGAVSTTNSPDFVYGTAASLLLNWQPITFGQRTALINEAVTSSNIQRAESENEIFKFKAAFIQSYLDWIMITELEKLSQQNIERGKFNLVQSKALVAAGLRPGADTALFQSELSKLRIEFLQVRRYKYEQAIRLQGFLNSESLPEITGGASLLKVVPNQVITADSITNPFIDLTTSYIAHSKARKTSIQRSLFPRLTVWGTTFARGTGIDYSESVDFSKSVLSFDRYNYGLGVQLAVPLLKFSAVRLQVQQQNLNIQANQENLNQAKLQLRNQLALADSSLQNAREIVMETPIQYQAAQFSYNALQSRYSAGSLNLSDLLQAQYSLQRAETDLKKSYIDLWKAFLFKATTIGDLHIFLKAIPRK